MRKLNTLKSLLLSAIVLFGVNSAHASPITALDYSGGPVPGVAMEVTATGVFQTAGGAALTSFLNWASLLPAVDGLGKIRITGVKLIGLAQQNFGTIAQETQGGLIEALDNANNVLLSATFTSGVISLAKNGSGSQFAVGLATFGGVYASYFVPTSATHTVSLINWSEVNVFATQIGQSSGFGNGLLGGNTANVPEPATMLLLGTGALGAALKRRKSA